MFSTTSKRFKIDLEWKYKALGNTKVDGQDETKRLTLSIEPISGIFSAVMKKLKTENKVLYTSANEETFVMNYVTRIHLHGSIEILKYLIDGCPRIRKPFHQPITSRKDFQEKRTDIILSHDKGGMYGNPLHWHYQIIYQGWASDGTRSEIPTCWQMQPILSDDSELYLILHHQVDDI